MDMMRDAAEICYLKLKDIECITCPHKPEGSMFVMVKLDLSCLDNINDIDFCSKVACKESVVTCPDEICSSSLFKKKILATTDGGPTALLVANYLIQNNKGDTLAASYYHQVHGTTAVGGEIAHTFSSDDNTVTFGTQHDLDALTTVKACFNNFGIASALLQHAWRPKSLITFSTEVDTKAIEKRPKFGLALALKP